MKIQLKGNYLNDPKVYRNRKNLVIHGTWRVPIHVYDSEIILFGNVEVYGYGNSKITLHDDCWANIEENCHVNAYDKSLVIATRNKPWDIQNCVVEAYDKSSIYAHQTTLVKNHSQETDITLFNGARCQLENGEEILGPTIKRIRNGKVCI